MPYVRPYLSLSLPAEPSALMGMIAGASVLEAACGIDYPTGDWLGPV